MAKEKTAAPAERTEDRFAEDIAAEFIRNNRRLILVVALLAAAGFAGFMGFSVVRGLLEKNAIAKVDAFSRQLSELEDPAASGGEGLLEEINAFAPKTFGYAAAKAYSLAGEIYAAKKNWAEAEKSWALSAKKAPGIFLAPAALSNAAAASEEQGNLEKSIEYHNLCVEYRGLNPVAARSQFSIGRIREQQNDKAAALEAYRKVVQNWPDDPNWTNLAQSRIIVLSQ